MVDAVNFSSGWLTLSTLAPIMNSVGIPERRLSTRERLIEAATQLVNERGLSAVTFREIGRRTGVSHNAVHKHFGSRQNLLAAIAAAELARLRESLARTNLGSQRPIERLRKQMLMLVRSATKRPEMHRLTFALGVRLGDSPELGEAASSAYEAFLSSVHDAQEAGELPAGPPERLGALLWSAAHGAADLARNGHLGAAGKERASPEEIVLDLFAYLERAGAL